MVPGLFEGEVKQVSTKTRYFKVCPLAKINEATGKCKSLLLAVQTFVCVRMYVSVPFALKMLTLKATIN